MKNLKIVKASLFTLMLAFMAIGTVAIAKEVMKKDVEPTVVEVVNTETWYFTGGPNDSPLNPDLYTTDPNQAPPCGLPLQTICQIEAPDDGDGKPDMGASVEEEDEEVTVAVQIEEALQSLSSTATPNNTVKEFRSH